MKKFTSAFFAGLLGAVAAVGVCQSANAETAPRCGRVAGYKVCAYDRQYVDTLEILWNDGDYTSLAVECQHPDGAKWKSRGYFLGRAKTNQIVRAWCFE